MNHVAVESKQIKSVAYDPGSRTMEIIFHRSGDAYRYLGVSPDQHAALMGAKSIGSHFHTHIRRIHQYQKL